MAISRIAEAQTTAPISVAPPDKEKVSYALGMQVGLQAKQVAATVDASSFAQAVKDVLAGKPTQFKESEMDTLLNHHRTSDDVAKLSDKDIQKISYAQGMRLGLQLKHANAEVNTDEIAQAIKDVQAGKPTKIQEDEIAPLFTQAQAYEAGKQSAKNQAEGEAFLAKNAKAPGITVLPDGLQYRVIKAGTGEIPKDKDLILVKYRGTTIDDTELDHNDHLITMPTGGIEGWQQALHLMKIGSKWQIFVPPALAFGHAGASYKHIGPDMTLIYELELDSIVPPGSPMLGTGRMGHGLGQPISPTTVK